MPLSAPIPYLVLARHSPTTVIRCRHLCYGCQRHHRRVVLMPSASPPPPPPPPFVSRLMIVETTSRRHPRLVLVAVPIASRAPSPALLNHQQRSAPWLPRHGGPTRLASRARASREARSECETPCVGGPETIQERRDTQTKEKATTNQHRLRSKSKAASQ